MNEYRRRIGRTMMFAGALAGALAGQTAGSRSVSAQEAPRPILVDQLGGNPYADGLQDLCRPERLEEAANLAIRGGMRTEARSAFIVALQAACAPGARHEIVEIGRGASGTVAPRTLSFMLTRDRATGVADVLGVGNQDVLLDTRNQNTVVGRNVPSIMVRFSYQAGGVTYNEAIAVPFNCINISGYSSEAVLPPPPPPPPPPVLARTAPRSPAQWSIQEGVVAADCCQTRVVNGLLIAEYSGTVEDAQRYFAANLRRPADGVQTLRPRDYQEGFSQPFAYLVVRDPSTGQETFWCMELNNPGRFSRPVIVTGGGRGEPSRRTEVRTRAQFDALTRGTVEFNENFSLTGSGRGADISVVSITEPTPLTVVDRDGDGVGEGFAVNPMTRRDALESQMSLIARTVFPVSTDPVVNARADRLWAQIAAAPIPETFITGRTEGARISALRTAFPELTAVEARQLASFLHYYGGVDRGAERGDQFVAEYRTGGAPRTVGGFFNAGVGAEATAGVYPGVRSGQ